MPAASLRFVLVLEFSKSQIEDEGRRTKDEDEIRQDNRATVGWAKVAGDREKKALA